MANTALTNPANVDVILIGPAAEECWEWHERYGDQESP